MPSFIPVEYDPFAPVPVDHDPWDGHPDPFAYRPPETVVSSSPDSGVFGRIAAEPPADNRDTIERAPGQSYQGYIGEQLHPNELGIYAAPKPPPAGDIVLPPSTAYAAPYMPRVGLGEDQRLFSQQANTSFESGPYSGSARISDRRYYEPYSLTPQQALPLTPEEQEMFMQRYPLAGDVPPATPPRAWFENTPLFQGNQPEPAEVPRGGGPQGPYPGPTGITGDYAGRGALRDYFGKYSPLRGTYRHTFKF